MFTASARILLLGIVMINACQTDSTKTVIDPDTGYRSTFHLSKEDSLYHGPYTKTDSAGVLLESGNYDSGELTGIRELFFPDGKVKVRERYKNGQITDLYEYYFPNGQKELEGYYIDGAMYGPWKKYDDQGNLLEVVTMIDNEEMGPFEEYHPNGKPAAQGAYLHGPNENGILKLFDESGELYKTMLCDSGRCYTQWEKM